MTRVRRKVVALRGIPAAGSLQHFLLGEALRTGNPSDVEQFDRDVLLVAWRGAIGDEIRAAFAAHPERRRPRPLLRRPYGWWLFDSPKPRNLRMPEWEQLRAMDQLDDEEWEFLEETAKEADE